MSGLFDRDGHEIDVARWALLFEDRRYQILRQTDVGDVAVSTVWLGINHNFLHDGPPLIFETMVFDPDHDGGETHRYATEEEALAGHDALVAGLRLLAEAIADVDVET